MSQLLASQPGSSSRHLASGAVRAWLARLAAAIVREWRYRQDLQLLQELDTRALHDLGITAGGLEHLVRHGRPFRSPQSDAKGARPRHDPCGHALMPPSWTEWR